MKYQILLKNSVLPKAGSFLTPAAEKLKLKHETQSKNSTTGRQALSSFWEKLKKKTSFLGIS